MSAQRRQPSQMQDIPAVAAPSTMDRVKLGLALLAGAALVVFLFQNLQEVEVNFLWFEWSTRMIWALLASALAGIVGAFAVATIRGRRRPKVATK